jgi:hypothetical protein
VDLSRGKNAQSAVKFCAQGAKAKSQYFARGELHENIL